MHESLRSLSWIPTRKPLNQSAEKAGSPIADHHSSSPQIYPQNHKNSQQPKPRAARARIQTPESIRISGAPHLPGAPRNLRPRSPFLAARAGARRPRLRSRPPPARLGGFELGRRRLGAMRGLVLLLRHASRRRRARCAAPRPCFVLSSVFRFWFWFGLVCPLAQVAGLFLFAWVFFLNFVFKFETSLAWVLLWSPLPSIRICFKNSFFFFQLTYTNYYTCNITLIHSWINPLTQ